MDSVNQLPGGGVTLPIPDADLSEDAPESLWEEELSEGAACAPARKGGSLWSALVQVLAAAVVLLSICGLLLPLAREALDLPELSPAEPLYQGETFSLYSNGSSVQRQAFHAVDPLEEALLALEIPTALLPEPVPEGFQPVSICTVGQKEDSLQGVSVHYLQADAGEQLDLLLFRQKDPSEALPSPLPGDGRPIEVCSQEEMAFFLFSDRNRSAASWSDGRSLLLVLQGRVSRETLLAFLQAIPYRPQDALSPLLWDPSVSSGI